MNQRVKDLMTPDPHMISPGATLQEAAQRMKQIECGSLPVGDKQEVQGMITDRDIVIRAVAEGADVTSAKVSDYLTPGACSCQENDTAEQAADIMRQNKVARVIVKDEQGNISGILTFGRIIRREHDQDHLQEIIEHARPQKAA